MDAPARAVSGLTPSAKALYVAGAAQELPHGVVLYVVPSDGDPRGGGCRRALLPRARSKGLSRVGGRSRGPAVSARMKSIPTGALAPHVGVTSARARALHALATGAARVIVASAAALLPRVSAPERLLAASIELRPGPGHRARRPRRSAGRRRLHAARIRRTSTGSSPSAEAFSTCFRPATAQPVRLEFIGDTIESIRTYDPARSDRSSRSIRSASSRCATCCRMGRRRIHVRSVGDALRLPRPRQGDSRILVSERDEVETQRRSSWSSRWSEATGRRSPNAGRQPPRAPARRRSPTCSRSGMTFAAGSSTRRRSLNSGSDAPMCRRRIRAAPANVSVEPAGGRDARAASPTGSPRFAACERPGRDHVCSWPRQPGRAERTIELLKEYEVFAAPVERAEDAKYAAVLVAVGRAVARLPAARRRPADLRGSRRLRGRTPGPGAPPAGHARRSFRICATSRSAISSSTSITASACSSASSRSASATARRSSSSCATPARTSSSCRSSGSISSRSTPARTRPPVDRLGGTSWERAKSRVKKAMRDMAEELLKLYAARRAVPGHAFSADSHWQQEFEDAFEYELTPDQRTRDRRHQARHGIADADGPPAVRRRRLRQDGSGDARRVQGGDGRQAGRVPRADDRAGVPASRRRSRSGSPASRSGSRWSAGSAARPSRRSRSPTSPPARSTSSSARIGCCRRTSSSATSACWSWTRSSASASRTRRGSSSCGGRSTC